MDVYQIKKDLDSFSPNDVNVLARYYSLPKSNINDLRWMIALMHNTKKATLPRGEILPLELTSGEEFDGCQKLFLRWDAYDLILIENATEIAKEEYILPNLEKILAAIAKEFDDAVFLDSQTFNVDDNDNLDDDAKIRKYVRDNWKTIHSGKTVFTTLALNMGEAGGHYGAYIFTPNETLYVYDSMTASEEETSVYIDAFEELGNRIFDPKEILINACINTKTYIQPTGGFPINIDPTREEQLLSIYNSKIPSHTIPWGESREDILKRERKRCKRRLFKLRNQIPESQDHFCPMWSMWLILADLLDVRVDKVVKRGKLIPLVIIKRFVWAVVQYLRLGNNKLYQKYFPVVWLQTDYETTPYSVSTRFAPYQINPPLTRPQSMEDCFNYSIEDMELTRIPPTNVPQRVYDAMDQVTEKCEESSIGCRLE